MASSSRKRKLKPWKWRLEWLAQTGLESLAALLPGPVVYRLGLRLGGLAWYLMRSRRQIVLRNLRIAFYGEQDLPTLQQMVRENFRRTGANLLSALHSTRLSADQVDAITSVVNPELAEAAFQRGPGIVMMPPHMGNWEILTRIQRKYPTGQRLGAFYRPLNNPLLDARVLNQRQAEGSKLFSKRDSFHQATTFLREGGVLGILADQRVGRVGEVAPFFGRLTRITTLPYLMARRSRCEVLGFGVATASPGKWLLYYEKTEGTLSPASCMDAVERTMRKSPLDVFWFQERWKVYIRPTHTIQDWLGMEGKTGAKPHRALLWLAGTPTGWSLPEAWRHPDVIYEAVIPNSTLSSEAHDLKGKFHRAPDSSTAAHLKKFLEKVDASHGLPVDYILTHNAPKTLVKAARDLSIPLVSLDATA